MSPSLEVAGRIFIIRGISQGARDRSGDHFGGVALATG
jgi:hypothetical protein